MYDSDDDTAFTDHLLDQFSAYYTITVVAVHLFMQWKAHHKPGADSGIYCVKGIE